MIKDLNDWLAAAFQILELMPKPIQYCETPSCDILAKLTVHAVYFLEKTKVK